MCLSCAEVVVLPVVIYIACKTNMKAKRMCRYIYSEQILCISFILPVLYFIINTSYSLTK